MENAGQAAAWFGPDFCLTAYSFMVHYFADLLPGSRGRVYAEILPGPRPDTPHVTKSDYSPVAAATAKKSTDGHRLGKKANNICENLGASVDFRERLSSYKKNMESPGDILR